MLGNVSAIYQYMYDNPYDTQVMPRRLDLCLYQPDKGGQWKTINAKSHQNIPRDSSDATIRQTPVRRRETSQLTVDKKPVTKSEDSIETKELLKEDHRKLLISLFDALCVSDFDLGLKPFHTYFTISDMALLEKMILAKMGYANSLDEARVSVMELYLTEISKKAPTINELLKCLQDVNLFAASELLKKYFEIEHHV